MLIHTDPDVYGPREDTHFLLDTLKNEHLSGVGLEMGTGTGIIAVHVSQKFDRITAADIDKKAVELAVHNSLLNNISNMHVVHSDLFTCIDDTFDVIIFNPPYVPCNEVCTPGNVCYHGGDNGRKVLDAFIDQFPEYITPQGSVYLLQSSLCGIKKTYNLVTQKGFEPCILRTKPLFFEKLVIFKITGGYHDQT
ncbi:MAG: methyltransferase [Candidatus Methanofastidiosia archaeon]|jgi:release factor glutamine methyltransferase